jgi:hypothetical protein
MYKALQKFLALYHHLSIPGIGNFSVETVPAQIDFTNRSISSSHKKIVFSNEKHNAEKKFYDFLAKELHIDEVQAIVKFTDFTDALQHTLTRNNSIDINGIGKLTKQSSQVLIFQPAEIPEYFPALTAEKVIRKNTAHTVRVGEDEKTSDEMIDALQHVRVIKKDRWWIAATILAVIGIAAIVYYYMTHK